MNTIEKAAPRQPTAQTVEPTSTPLVPLDLLHRAIESGASPEVWEKMMALHERWEANQARKAFDTAIAEAKAKIPVINKNRRVDFSSPRGRTQYSYEDFAEIARMVNPVLGPLGLTYRFRTATLAPDTIAVTCRLSHRDGYSEETTLPGILDTSGNKNSNQATGSTVTYLQRYTLKCALGLASSDDDDDGQAGGKPSENKNRSADEYIDSWQIYLEDADSADEVIAKWKDERTARNKIKWPDLSEVTKLTEQVTKRIEKLKQEDKQPDLITQRLRAEDT